jgi:hypothetical protein
MMKRIVFTWRLGVRKVLTSLLGAVSFLFGSCPGPQHINPGWAEYGPGPDPVLPVEVISGTVKDSCGVPVPRFWVSILNEYNSSPGPYTFTNTYGEFIFEIYEYDKGSSLYTLFFQDVDGPLNGEFNSKTVQWRSGDEPLHIVLEPKEPEPEQ